MGEEHNLLFQISRQYQTEDSTRRLAQKLPDYDHDNIVSQINDARKENVDWRLMAYDVLMEWVKYSISRARSLDLLRALQETNPVAARSFAEALTCGKDLYFLSFFFGNRFGCFFFLPASFHQFYLLYNIHQSVAFGFSYLNYLVSHS